MNDWKSNYLYSTPQNKQNPILFKEQLDYVIAEVITYNNKYIPGKSEMEKTLYLRKHILDEAFKLVNSRQVYTATYGYCLLREDPNSPHISVLVDPCFLGCNEQIEYNGVQIL